MKGTQVKRQGQKTNEEKERLRKKQKKNNHEQQEEISHLTSNINLMST